MEISTERERGPRLFIFFNFEHGSRISFGEERVGEGYGCGELLHRGTGGRGDDCAVVLGGVAGGGSKALGVGTFLRERGEKKTMGGRDREGFLRLVLTGQAYRAT